MSDIPISYPGRFAPGMAVNYADSTGAARQVSQSSPLPVTLVAATTTTGTGGTTSAALTATATAVTTAGPFAPVAGKPIILTLAGSWIGKVTLLRSINGGTTRVPLSLAGTPWAVFTGNVCEPVWDETETGATFYLQLAPDKGAIVYRVAQ
ncbi:MAG: hypothetical protein ABIT09_09085 [Croceibacterium sp.]